MELDLAILHTGRVPLESVGNLFSTLASKLSIGRAQIVTEQIRRAAQSGHLDRLVVLATWEDNSQKHPLAAVVVVLQPGLAPESISDVATVVHAGALQALDEASRRTVIAELSAALDADLRSQGIRIVQWATDPAEPFEGSRTPNTDSAPWCAELGFQPIATLDYLCGPVLDDPRLPLGEGFVPASDSRRLHFSPVSWIDAAAFSALIELVEQTYIETLDCPALANFLSTRQVLDGYRAADSFTPGMWFIVSNDEGLPIGCTILGAHPASPATNSAKPPKPVGSVEIVYMGLIPAARGNGLGTQLVQKAFDAARELGADQVLLAVDERNHPAKAVYQLAGLSPVVRESVWVKAITKATNTTTETDLT